MSIDITTDKFDELICEEVVSFDAPGFYDTFSIKTI
jgi:hypothetical protein